MKALGRGSIASVLKVVLDIAWVVLWLAAFVIALGTVVYLGVVGAVAAGWAPAEWLDGDSARVRVAGVETTLEGGENMAWTLIVSGLIGAGVFIAGALVIVSRLKRLFANFISEKPFVMENASHLRVIWIAMLTLEVARYAVAGLAVGLAHLFKAGHGEMSVEFQLQLESWFAIFTLMVLAEVFRVGARMREEQDLTI